MYGGHGTQVCMSTHIQVNERKLQSYYGSPKADQKYIVQLAMFVSLAAGKPGYGARMARISFEFQN